MPPVQNQPKTFRFAQRSYGIKEPGQRSFQPSWFDSRPWMHYDESQDRAFCHLCMLAYRDRKLRNLNLDKAYILNGYSNGKEACVSFRKHEASKCHQESVLKVESLPKAFGDIGEKMSKTHSEEKSDNRDCLRKILSSIRFLARQGISLRGDDDESDGNGDDDEIDGNYTQILKACGEDDSRTIEWLKRKNDKYTCVGAQNEMIQIMTSSILRDIAQNIRNSVFFSIMAGETTDLLNREQFVLVLIHVDEKLIAHEGFIGLKKLTPLIRTLLPILLKTVFFE